MPKLGEIKTRVELSYPTPIALTASRVRTRAEGTGAARLKGLIDIFEVTIKFLSILGLQTSGAYIQGVGDILRAEGVNTDSLKRPSLGTWVQLLRTLATSKSFDIQKLQQLRQWFQSSQDDLKRLSQNFSALAGLTSGGSKKAPGPQVALDTIVVARNKLIGHGALLDENALKNICSALEELVAEFLVSAEGLLVSGDLIVVDEVVVESNTLWTVRGRLSMGVSPEPIELRVSASPERESLIWCGKEEGGYRNWISISPFMMYEKSSGDYFIYNDAMRTRLEYVSYSTGNFFEHKQLHKDLESILRVSLNESDASDQYIHLPAKERERKADQFYRLALSEESSGRLEPAIEYAEEAVCLVKSADYFSYLASLQLKIGDPVEYVETTLQRALEVQPDHITTLALFERIVNGELAARSIPNNSKNDSNAIQKDVFVVYSLPRPIRRYWLALFVGSSLAWYGISAFLSASRDFGLPLSAYPIFSLLIVLAWSWVSMASSLLKSIHRSLSLQVTERLESFDCFFHETLKYAGTCNEQQATAIKVSFAHAALWLLLVVPAIYLTDGTVGGDGRTKVAIDFFVLFVAAGPAIQTIIGTAAFIYLFSKRQIKPMLTSLNDEGLKAFGNIITFHVLMLFVIWTLYWLLAYITVDISKYPYPYRYLDLVFVVVALVIASSVLFGMPVAVWMAGKAARRKAAHSYVVHVEDAFTRFLDNPDANSLERYNWLLSKQDVISGIRSWPLSRMQTAIFIIFGIGGISLVTYIYVAFRLQLLLF